MDYIKDTQFLMMVFILPALFGVVLLGEGVSKIMNYDNKGWIGIGVGCVFLAVLILAFLVVVMGVELF